MKTCLHNTQLILLHLVLKVFTKGAWSIWFGIGAISKITHFNLLMCSMQEKVLWNAALPLKLWCPWRGWIQDFTTIILISPPANIDMFPAAMVKVPYFRQWNWNNIIFMNNAWFLVIALPCIAYFFAKWMYNQHISKTISLWCLFSAFICEGPVYFL